MFAALRVTEDATEGINASWKKENRSDGKNSRENPYGQALAP